MTFVGILDIVIGGLGLAAASGLVIWSGVLLWFIAVTRESRPSSEGHLGSGAGLAISRAIPALLLFALASALANGWLFATGIQLLQCSRHARRSALAHACLIVLLGAIVMGIASQAGDARWIVQAFILPLPLYAVAQVAAFFVVPSWKALNGSAQPSIPHDAIGP